jgi:hypothetical protein
VKARAETLKSQADAMQRVVRKKASLASGRALPRMRPASLGRVNTATGLWSRRSSASRWPPRASRSTSITSGRRSRRPERRYTERTTRRKVDQRRRIQRPDRQHQHRPAKAKPIILGVENAIWQYWPRRGFVRAAPALPGTTRIRLPSASPPCCDKTAAKVSHLHSNNSARCAEWRSLAAQP